MPLYIVRNDITKMHTDAIVNAANSSLIAGGGVDGAIHKSAGPLLQRELNTLGGCEPGKAVFTKGYGVALKNIIHTVGPIWTGGMNNEDKTLKACYLNSLSLAEKLNCETVSFPLISAGVYGYPKAEAFNIAQSAILEYLNKAQSDMTVYMVLFSKQDLVGAGTLSKNIRQYIDDVYAEEHLDAPTERMRMQRAYSRQNASYAYDRSAELERMLDRIDESFAQMLKRKIDEKGMKDSACYKKANVDRKLFNKIINNASYRTGKQTALALALALELPLEELKEMVEKAGYSFTRSDKGDIVVEYCVKHGIYDIFSINQVLFEYDLRLLGGT